MFNFIKKNTLIQRIERIEKDVLFIKDQIVLINNYITLLAAKPPSVKSPVPYNKMPKCFKCNSALDASGLMCENFNCPNSIKAVF